MLMVLQAFSKELLSYDPFFYEDRDFIELLGIMDTKVNLNGKWYQAKDTFEGLLIKEVQKDCVILGERKICLAKKRLWED